MLAFENVSSVRRKKVVKLRAKLYSVEDSKSS